MEWLEWDQLPGKKIPRWKRTLGYEKITNEVFVPAAITGNEENVLLCALYDGTPVAEIHKHMYVPATWITKEFPKVKDICDAMVESARKSLATAS